MRYYKWTMFYVALFLLLPVLAFAQSTDGGWGADLLLLFSAAKGGAWVIVGGVFCSLLVRLARMDFFLRWVPWFGTSIGGPVLAASIALLTTVGATLIGGKIDWSIIVNAIVVFAIATVSYVIPHDLKPSAEKTTIADVKAALAAKA